jgi:hypothetical protein
MIRRVAPALLAVLALLVVPAGTVAQAKSHQSPCEKAHVDASCHHIKVVGHRFTEYPTSKTNEDTLKALEYIHAHKIKYFETDVWKSADGHPFIWHDQTWARVASAASLKKAGLKGSDNVVDATWAQIQLVRTKGGQPVPSLKKIMKYAIQHKMIGKFELKWDMPNPKAEFTYAKSIGNPNYVTFYQGPHAGTCALTGVQAAHAAGFKVGISTSPACPIADAQLAKYSYVELPIKAITAAHVKKLHKLNKKLQIGNQDSASKSSWNKLVHDKVDFIIAPSPRKLKTWLG